MPNRKTLETSDLNLIPLGLPNNAVVYLKAARVPAKYKALLETTPSDFGEVAATIEGISQSVIAAWRKVKPSTATLEFGLELEGGTGKLVALLAAGKATAHLTVTLEWSSS